MIYAEITYIEDKGWNGYYLEFHWENSIQETDLWNTKVLTYYNNKLWKEINFDGKYLNSKRIILTHLAERKLIPWGDNIFYRKWLLDFLRQ